MGLPKPGHASTWTPKARRKIPARAGLWRRRADSLRVGIPTDVYVGSCLALRSRRGLRGGTCFESGDKALQEAGPRWARSRVLFPNPISRTRECRWIANALPEE